MIDPEISKAIAIIESQMAEKDRRIEALEQSIRELNATISAWTVMWRAVNALA